MAARDGAFVLLPAPGSHAAPDRWWRRSLPANPSEPPARAEDGRAVPSHRPESAPAAAAACRKPGPMLPRSRSAPREPLIIYAPSWPRPRPLAGPTGAEQTHRVLAMQATHRHEFIQNAPPFLPIARGVTSRQRHHQLVSCRHADLPHVRPRRCTPVGSKLSEATGRLREHFRRGNAALIQIVALHGLFSLITLWANEVFTARTPAVRIASWYRKSLPTFSDALASVRRQLWTIGNLSGSRQMLDPPKIPSPRNRGKTTGGVHFLIPPTRRELIQPGGGYPDRPCWPVAPGVGSSGGEAVG